MPKGPASAMPALPQQPLDPSQADWVQVGMETGHRINLCRVLGQYAFSYGCSMPYFHTKPLIFF